MVYFIGAGPGAVDLITVKIRKSRSRNICWFFSFKRAS